VNVTIELPDALHPETQKLVKDFAEALAEKLRAAEEKYGYGDSWRTSDWERELPMRLLEHAMKGDPRDVAAYCAFAWARGWSTTPALTVQLFMALEDWAIEHPWDEVAPEIRRQAGWFAAAFIRQCPDPRPTTGLCDSDGRKIYVGDVLRRPVTINQEFHGAWSLYQVKMQAGVPITSYLRSETGGVLPAGYLACPLSELYNSENFLFATDPSCLRPVEHIVVVPPDELADLYRTLAASEAALVAELEASEETLEASREAGGGHVG